VQNSASKGRKEKGISSVSRNNERSKDTLQGANLTRHKGILTRKKWNQDIKTVKSKKRKALGLKKQKKGRKPSVKG